MSADDIDREIRRKLKTLLRRGRLSSVSIGSIGYRHVSLQPPSCRGVTLGLIIDLELDADAGGDLMAERPLIPGKIGPERQRRADEVRITFGRSAGYDQLTELLSLARQLGGQKRRLQKERTS